VSIWRREDRGNEDNEDMAYSCMDIWIYGYMDIWIYGYMDIWIYG
jgi:hypothetical protein